MPNPNEGGPNLQRFPDKSNEARAAYHQTVGEVASLSESSQMHILAALGHLVYVADVKTLPMPGYSSQQEQ